MQSLNPSTAELTQTLLTTITELGKARAVNPHDTAFRQAWEIGTLHGIVKTLSEAHPTARSTIHGTLQFLQGQLATAQHDRARLEAARPPL